MRQIILAVSPGVGRSGLITLFNNEGWRCDDRPSNRYELLQALQSPAERIVIVDRKFCSQGIKSLVRGIRRQAPQTKVLFWGFTISAIIDLYMSEEVVDGWIYQYADEQDWIKACLQLNHGGSYVMPYLASLFRRLKDISEEQPLLRGLSKRERLVLQLICSGDTVSEISEKLYISRKTVNTFRYRLFKKTGARGDVELTHLAISSGLVPITPIRTEPGQLPIVA